MDYHSYPYLLLLRQQRLFKQLRLRLQQRLLLSFFKKAHKMPLLKFKAGALCFFILKYIQLFCVKINAENAAVNGTAQIMPMLPDIA